VGALNQRQLELMKEIFEEYLAAPPETDGLTPAENAHNWDESCDKIIEEKLDPLLKDYLDGKIPLSNFKSTVDSINKRESLWGFRGIKGQMFFNMVFNVADDPDECDQELKAAIAVPANDQIASSRIKTFTSYVRRIGDQWVEVGNTRHGSPKIGSIPFFLSYFWHLQSRNKWPIYYTNDVNTMTDLNLWQPTGDLSEDYLIFKSISEELTAFFSKVSGKPFKLYQVGHIFWYKGTIVKDKSSESKDEGTKVIKQSRKHDFDRLPDSYVPPIIAILPQIACHDEILASAANKSGTTLDRAFEKYVNAAFTILSYETKLMGQGKGRVQDGLALARDDNYAILWDTKVRSNGYSMGTDDRTIREYITTQSRELKRKRLLKNIYYLIISSRFADDFDDAIRSIKMETDVSEVSLVEADALVEMVDAKLRAPLQITLGPDGLQRIFSVSGIVNAEMVKEQLN